MRETSALQPSQISVDETPLPGHLARILGLLHPPARPPRSELITPPRTRGRLLGLFLATLELIRSRTVWVEHPDAFGDLWLRLAGSADGADCASQDGSTV